MYAWFMILRGSCMNMILRGAFGYGKMWRQKGESSSSEGHLVRSLENKEREGAWNPREKEKRSIQRNKKSGTKTIAERKKNSSYSNTYERSIGLKFPAWKDGCVVIRVRSRTSWACDGRSRAWCTILEKFAFTFNKGIQTHNFKNNSVFGWSNSIGEFIFLRNLKWFMIK